MATYKGFVNFFVFSAKPFSVKFYVIIMLRVSYEANPEVYYNLRCLGLSSYH